MTIEVFLFYLFALLTCGGAVSVVICQNVVRMAFSLIISLASISALFFLLSADFVGATQLMVYVGGTIVLLIFGVMLTSSSTLMQIRTSPAEGFLAAGIGVLFLSVFSFTVWSVEWDEERFTGKAVEIAETDNVEATEGETIDRSFEAAGYNSSRPGDRENSKGEIIRQNGIEGNTVRPLAMAFVGLRPDKDGMAPGYMLPFEIVSVHLLVVLVGAAYLARTKRRVSVES
ncbi:MAG: NADH-quinone oxidoreductase subunit J family protein [Planctomycetales bacterium]